MRRTRIACQQEKSSFHLDRGEKGSPSTQVLHRKYLIKAACSEIVQMFVLCVTLCDLRNALYIQQKNSKNYSRGIKNYFFKL